MVIIKIGRKKVKIFNLILLIFCFIVFIYLICSLFFMLPIFNTKYSYNINKENYSIKASASFRKSLFNCNLKEKYVLDIKDKDIKQYLYQDLINDGFKKKKNNVFIRKSKSFGLCKDDIKEYKKIHNKKYISFQLNGSSKVELEYNNNYIDEYVSVSNKKYLNNIELYSNFNAKKIGKYIIAYKLSVDDSYNQMLYRIINVVDKEKPVITLNGNMKMELDYGEKYIEEGFNALDNYDGNITGKVTIKNTVNEKKPGNYKITYSVKDSSGNKEKVEREVIVKESQKKVTIEKPIIEEKDGLTYVNGILLVNKIYGLPKDYDPKVNKEAYNALKQMQSAASILGIDIPLISGYRSYETQKKLYDGYVKEDGEQKANTYSAKPGYSEHQTGLAFDIGKVDSSFANTLEAKWIEENAHVYGFIVRYPKDKTEITGYIYEPWHIRYLGIDLATKVYNSGLCLEEYLKVN